MEPLGNPVDVNDAVVPSNKVGLELGKLGLGDL